MMISVVVAVRNEVNHIQDCLQSLFTQDYQEPYEVIVVDGMSTDGTYEKLTRLQEQYRFVLLKNEKFNAAAGRNIGINNSTGEIIAFIDGDAIAATDWLKQIQTTFEHTDAVGVGGPDLLPPGSSRTARMIGYVMTSAFARGGRFNPSTQHTTSEEEKYVYHIPTCNLALERDVFTIVGLFDESFVKGQDLELNYRIVTTGHKLLYSPNIKVVHHRKQYIKDFSKQIYKWAKAKVAIIKKHGMHGISSHVYLWPLYAVAGFFVFLGLFFLFHILSVFILLFAIGILMYFSLIIVESGRLTWKYSEKKLFSYSLALLPILHISYACGVLVASIKRKIW
jgi:glycosyltransferase involved in cell wall biosynthesis